MLLPIGARFLPTASGCEGGADDRRIRYADGREETAQISKTACHVDTQTVFRCDMRRHNGSVRDADGKKKELTKQYAEGENDRYVIVLLGDDETLAQYWAPSEAELVLSESVADRIITGVDGRGGAVGARAHGSST